MAGVCRATTKRGTACAAPGGAGGLCWWHDPARGAERAAARSRGGQHRRTARGVPAEDWPADVHDLAGVLALLNTELRDAVRLENSVSRGRLVVALAGELVHVLSVGELETRLAAVEAVLKAGRNDKRKSA